MKNLDNALIKYNYSNLQTLLFDKNFIHISEDSSEVVFGKSIKYAMTGSYTGGENIDMINPTLVRHIAQMGFYCRVGTNKKEKFIEIWRPELLLHKTIDWSFFEDGTAIPNERISLVDKIVGRHVEKGAQNDLPIKLKFNGNYFDAILKNLGSGGRDMYHVRYDSNRALRDYFVEYFSEIYPYIKSQKEKNIKAGQSKAHIPIADKYYFELLVTDEPLVLLLNLSPDSFYSVNEGYELSEQAIKTIIKARTPGMDSGEVERKRIERLANYRQLHAGKRKSSANLYISNPILKEDIKQLYHYKCQFCGTQIKYKGWTSELEAIEELDFLTADAHHILALKNGGADIPANLVCVCPNCHRRLHSGEFEVLFGEQYPKCLNTETGQIFDFTINDAHSLKNVNSQDELKQKVTLECN